MDNEGQNKNPNNASGTQGIFSSPDLTVDTGKIAQTSSDNSRDKSRVTSFFASTDASQRAQQLNNAMNVSEAEQAGDVVVDNGTPKKNSKLPIIMAIIVLVAVVVGLVGYAATKITEPREDGETSEEAKTPLELFQSYADYAKNGPQTDGSDNNQADERWYIDDLYSEEASAVAIDEYVTELKTRYDSFLGKNDREDLAEGLVAHQQLLDTVVIYYSLDKINNELANIYMNDGDSVAQKYIKDLTPLASNQDEESTGVLGLAQGLEYDYLNARLNVLRYYKAGGCIKNAELDDECILNLDSIQLQQEEQYAASVRNSLGSLMPILINTYHKSVNAIFNTLEQA